MDILAHMIWANYGSKVLNKKLKDNKKETVKVWPTMIWSIFPDLFAFAIPIFIGVSLSLFSGHFNMQSLLDHHFTSGVFIIDLPSYLYQFSHSFIIWSLIFILAWVIFKKPQLVLLGWALHIFIDIFSHSIDFYPTPFLFPISEYRFPYGFRWSGEYFMIINYSLIAIIAIYLYFARNKKYE